jgi:hypothetical protein
MVKDKALSREHFLMERRNTFYNNYVSCSAKRVEIFAQTRQVADFLKSSRLQQNSVT